MHFTFCLKTSRSSICLTSFRTSVRQGHYMIPLLVSTVKAERVSNATWRVALHGSAVMWWLSLWTYDRTRTSDCKIGSLVARVVEGDREGGYSHMLAIWVCSAVKGVVFNPLRWLPRVSTKVTIRTGKTCRRSPSSVVLQSLFLNFTSKVTNIITLIFQNLLLRHRLLSWQQSI